jgi:hypothetical protein
MLDSIVRVVAKPLATVVAVAALWGCATMSGKPDDAVRNRADQVWKALVAGDLDKSYGFMPPSYRAVTPLERYKKGFGGAVKWIGAEVAWVKCDTEDKCIAHMKVDAQPFIGGFRRQTPPLTNYFDETWVREDGQWWLFPTP